MSQAPMQKVNLTASLSFKEAILEYLQKNEIMEIHDVRLPETPPPSPGINYELELAEIKFALDFISATIGIKKGFIEGLINPKIPIDEETFYAHFKKHDYRKVIEDCRGFEAVLSNLRNLKSKLKTDYENLSPWRDLPLELNKLGGTEHISFTLGVCRKKAFSAFKEKTERLTPVEIQVIHKTKTDLYLMLIYLKKEEHIILDFLSKTEFIPFSFRETPRTPKEELKYLQVLIKKAEEEEAELLEKVRALEKHRLPLMYVHDYLFQKRVNFETHKKLLDTKYTFIIEGWIKAADFTKLQKGIKKITAETELVKIVPKKDEIPPVIIENAKIMQPFETITRIFGLPKQTEFDPTLVLSFFFILFFGMCLGDVGYGLSLVAFSYFILKKLPLSLGGKNLIKLLLYGGIIAAGIGILTGSWFGLELETLPALIGQPLMMLRLINPLKSPLIMLGISVGLGLIQVIFGLFVNMFQNFANRKYADGILDSGSWIFFLISIVSYLITRSNIAGYFSLAGVGLLILTQGRNEKGIAKKLLVGVLSLYRSTSFMGDVLSYSRLLALGMTTSVIGMVINIIAGMTVHSIPILGYVIMLSILVLGHAFNLLVSVLGAFIHSTRLQLVEFFSKFYEGGGKEFKPFRRETKYITIKGVG